MSVPAVKPMAPNALFWEMSGSGDTHLTVVKVGAAIRDSFSDRVRATLAEKWNGRVRFAVVEIAEIDHQNDIVRHFIFQWRKQLGWPASTYVPSGYYLFRKVTALAYQDAEPTTEEQEAAFASVQAGSANRNFALFSRAAMEQAAIRVAVRLADVVEKIEAEEAQAKAESERRAKRLSDMFANVKAQQERKRLAALRRPLTQRDREAIKLLGVLDDYTLDELTAAKRAAQKMVHPDVSRLSPADSTRRSAACNDAFDVLKARIV